MDKKIIILVGPSGSGKTTVGIELEKHGLHKLITTTTRDPRPGEEDGVDYYFIDEDEVGNRNFLENTVYNNHIYGLTQEELEDKWALSPYVQVTLDRYGAESVRRLYPEETLVIYFESSLDEMRARMEARGDDKEKIHERLQHSIEAKELVPPEETDLILRNVDVQETTGKILDFIGY